MNGEKMSEGNNQRSGVTYKRIQKLKRLGILLLVVMPIVVAAGALVLVQGIELKKRLETVTSQMEQYKDEISEKEQQIQEWETLIAELEQEWDEMQQERAVMQAYIAEQEAAKKAAEELAAQYEEEPLHKVYLTFDDGPSVYTDEILEILDRYDVKATFFVVGKEDEASREALKKIAEAGHTVGLHSYSHNYDEIYASKEAFVADYVKIQHYVHEVTGQRSNFYRFPGGSNTAQSSMDAAELAQYMADEGVEFFDWNISSGDGSSVLRDVDSLVENCTASISQWRTSIVLLHDSADKSTTVEALPLIIENILAMEDTAILPITEETVPIHHIDTMDNE